MAYGVAGVEVYGAMKRMTIWGTARAMTSGDGLMLRPTKIKKDSNVLVDDSLGKYHSMDGTPGAIKVEGDIEAYLRYDSHELPLAMVLGTAGSPTQQGSTTAYLHTLKPATNTDGYFVTYCEDWKNYIREIPSLKITGFVIKGEVGKPVEISYKCIGIDKVHDSSTNTTSTFDYVTFRETANRVMFAQGVFRMNAQTGSALSGTDVIYPSSFELTYQRKMAGVYGQYKSGGCVQDLIDEPTNDGLPEVKLKLTFPRHSATTYLAALKADTRQKMDITFTGAEIASPYNRSFVIWLPNIQLTGDDPQLELGIIKEPLEFVCHGASSAPSGMTACTDAPLWVKLISQLATNPLA